jgi:hypothetical protein
VTSTLEIPPLGSLRQEDHELKATLSYIVKPCFKASKLKKKKKRERERERGRESNWTSIKSKGLSRAGCWWLTPVI